MEELRSRQKSIQSAAHHIALECIHPQVTEQLLSDVCKYTFHKILQEKKFWASSSTVRFFHTCLFTDARQSAHGSPYHVHPYPSPVRLQHAFNGPQAHASPKMFHPKGLKAHLDGRAYSTPSDSPVLGRALCLTPRGSPVPGRVSQLSDKFHDSLTLTADTDALVAKISAMFPTVGETHIKILLKKYYNREAVVISALQVEKHPITTPGPLSMSPCAARLQRSAVGVYSALQLAKGGSMHGSTHLTPLTGTPHGSPSLLRPASGASSYYGAARSVDGQSGRHQSPKMKLKYLKSIFPKAEETLILDVLANKDNNVQRASEELISMGFPKKETIVNNPPKKKEKDTPQPSKKVVTIMKTHQEKEDLKKQLKRKYSTVAERVIGLALESVDFNEDRAEQILAALMQEESTPRPARKNDEKPPRPTQPDVNIRGSAGEECEPRRAAPSAPRRLKCWAGRLKPILKSSSTVEARYKSNYTTAPKGPNTALRNGPKDSLLLEDYMVWNGPNPELHSGVAVRAEGPGPRERCGSLARGPSGLAKGPANLAKGSIYQKLTKKSAKMCVH